MDNLSSHKRPKVAALIEAAGASLLYLPPYSPDFNPIEKLFATFKALLRKAAERTIEGLWNAIGETLERLTQGECANYPNVSSLGADFPILGKVARVRSSSWSARTANLNV